MKLHNCYSLAICKRVLQVEGEGRRISFGLVVIVFTIMLTGCSNKTGVSKVPPPPPPAAPVAAIDASPANLEAGQSIVLTWKTENATDVRIEPLGAVDVSGTKSLTPLQSTTYRLIAKGPGGVQEAVARVTVTAGISAAKGGEELFSADGGRQDVFFNTDDYSISADQYSTISHDAEFLKEHPDLSIVIEGHCDELGSIEYNLALGDNRAHEVKQALVGAGVDAGRVNTISYGKERPFCTEESEECWRQNRRAHLVPSVQR